MPATRSSTPVPGIRLCFMQPPAFDLSFRVHAPCPARQYFDPASTAKVPVPIRHVRASPPVRAFVPAGTNVSPEGNVVLATATSGAVLGVDAYLVRVEVDMGRGL